MYFLHTNGSHFHLRKKIVCVRFKYLSINPIHIYTSLTMMMLKRITVPLHQLILTSIEYLSPVIWQPMTSMLRHVTALSPICLCGYTLRYLSFIDDANIIFCAFFSGKNRFK